MDIMKIWLRIVVCPSIIFFPDIFATITVSHKQIIAMAGYYACGAFISPRKHLIGLDKSGYQINIFLFLHENTCCGYSLEAPQQGASNEYPQHMFSWRNKKNINTFGLKETP